MHSREPHIQVAVDARCHPFEALVARGFSCSGARVDLGGRTGAGLRGSDLPTRFFKVSDRIGLGYSALELPLFEDDGPGPRLTRWFEDVASYLRFLDVRPSGGAWRMSLVLSELGDTSSCLPSADGAREILVMNPGDRAMIAANRAPFRRPRESA